MDGNRPAWHSISYRERSDVMECGTLIPVVSPLSGIAWLDWGHDLMLHGAATDRQLNVRSARNSGDIPAFAGVHTAGAVVLRW